MHPERTDREGLHAAAVPGGGVAAGEAGGVEVNGRGDGCSAPVRDLHTGPELGFGHGELLGDVGHQEVRALLVGVLLDQEREERDLAFERGGKQVVGVQVSDRMEDL